MEAPKPEPAENDTLNGMPGFGFQLFDEAVNDALSHGTGIMMLRYSNSQIEAVHIPFQEFRDHE